MTDALTQLAYVAAIAGVAVLFMRRFPIAEVQADTCTVCHQRLTGPVCDCAAW